jgi:hypothetical protein
LEEENFVIDAQEYIIGDALYAGKKWVEKNK